MLDTPYQVHLKKSRPLTQESALPPANRGLEIEDEFVTVEPNGRLMVGFPTEERLGIVPSFGITWEL